MKVLETRGNDEEEMIFPEITASTSTIPNKLWLGE